MKLKSNPVKIGTGQMKLTVQNFKNKNKELTNKFIGDSYYYQVGNSSPPTTEKDPAFSPKSNRVNEPIPNNKPSENDNKNYRVKVITKNSHIEDIEQENAVYYDNKKDLEKINSSKVEELSKKYKNFNSPAMAKDLKNINNDFQNEKIKVEAGAK